MIDASSEGRTQADWAAMAALIMMAISEEKPFEEVTRGLAVGWPDLNERDFEELHGAFSRIVYALRAVYLRDFSSGGTA